MSRREAPRDRLADERIRPDLFRTQPESRTELTPEAQAALRQLVRRSARSGKLSPLGYNLTISHQHRFVWFRVAKVATRTILGHFRTHEVTTEVHHAMRLRYPTALFGDYFKFAFVRHPLGRFVSAWRNKVVDHNYFDFDDATLARMQTVENFAHWTAQHDLADLTTADHHLALQSRLVDLTQVDYLGRLESFDRDFAEVCTRIGLPASEPDRLNRSTPHDLDQDTASDELRSVVADIYRRDFQVFGY